MSTLVEFRRLASELLSGYLNHQSWKAHDGVFAPVPFVYDGIAFILENPSIRQLNPLAMTVGQSRPVSSPIRRSR